MALTETEVKEIEVNQKNTEIKTTNAKLKKSEIKLNELKDECTEPIVKKMITYVPTTREVNSSKENSIRYMKQLTKLQSCSKFLETKIKDLNEKIDKNEKRKKSVNENHPPQKEDFLSKIKMENDNNNKKKLILTIIKIGLYILLVFATLLFVSFDANNTSKEFSVKLFFEITLNVLKNFPIFWLIVSILFIGVGSYFFALRFNKSSSDFINVDADLVLIFSTGSIIIGFFIFAITESIVFNVGFFAYLFAYIFGAALMVPVSFILFFLLWLIYLSITSPIISFMNKKKAEKAYNDALKSYEMEIKLFPDANEKILKNNEKLRLENEKYSSKIEQYKKILDETKNILNYYKQNVCINISDSFDSLTNKYAILHIINRGHANNVKEAVEYLSKSSNSNPIIVTDDTTQDMLYVIKEFDDEGDN